VLVGGTGVSVGSGVKVGVTVGVGVEVGVSVGVGVDVNVGRSVLVGVGESSCATTIASAPMNSEPSISSLLKTK
jgi:hypothetical protein